LVVVSFSATEEEPLDNLVFACIAPHGWLLIPLVSGPDGAKAHTSRAAMEELGRRMEAAQPDTIVIMEPHSLLVEGMISLLDSATVQGQSGGPTDLGAPGHGYSMTFAVDQELNAAIAAEARSKGVPVVRVRNFREATPLQIAWGTLTPLWYLGAAFPEVPKVVVASAGNLHGYAEGGPGRFGLGIPREDYIAFGRAVRCAAARTGRRLAFIASVDLGHRHTEDGPFGFDPAAAECDTIVVEAVRANALDRLLEIDAAQVDRGLTEAVEPLLALHGLLEGTDLRGEVLSYEVPTYFAMMCAAYGGEAAAPQV
jgi:aromatic ring-opening dioxygenase LigB subunit